MKAPYNGTITQRNIHPGVVVQPGVPVFIISSDLELEAQFGIPPSLVDSLKVGQDLAIQVRGQRVKATLKSINPQIDDETRTMRIVASLNKSSGSKFYAGDVVGLELSRSQPIEGFWLPLSSVMQGQRGLWECLVIENVDSNHKGTVAIRQIEVLHLDTDRVLVRGTLKNNEPVVASAISRLVQGQTVLISSENIAQTSEGAPR